MEYLSWYWYLKVRLSFPFSRVFSGSKVWRSTKEKDNLTFPSVFRHPTYPFTFPLSHDLPQSYLSGNRLFSEFSENYGPLHSISWVTKSIRTFLRFFCKYQDFELSLSSNFSLNHWGNFTFVNFYPLLNR